MDTNIVICIMIGLPGSGKTTLSRKLISKNLFPQFEIKVLTFSFDDFLPLEEQEKLVISLQDNIEFRLFRDARNKFADVVECTIRNELMVSSDSRETLKYLVIVDDNFYYKSMRYRFFQMASKYNCGFCQIYLACDVDVALERNHSRSNRVCEEVIKNMSDRIEPPTQTNSWEKQSITIATHLLDEKLPDICSLIEINYSLGLSILNLTSIQKAASQAINLQSLIHRADLILRSLVAKSVTMSKDQGSSKKEVALRVNIIRHNLLSDLRDKKLLIPITVIEGDSINIAELSQFLRNEFENCLK